MRAWMALLAVAFAAGSAWWFLWDEPTPEPVPDLADVETPGDVEAAPVLEGAARTDPVVEAGEGRFSIAGVVVDKQDNPVAGVPVELWRGSLAWPGQGYRAVLETNVVSVRSRATALRSGRSHTDVRVAQGMSGSDGRFAFRVDRAQYHTVYARPAAPKTGSYVSTHLAPTLSPSVDVKVRVYEGVPLRGRVVDGQDKPAQAEVKALYKNEWSGQVDTDKATGAFALEAVPDGKLRFFVTLPEGRQYQGFHASPPFDEVVLRLPDDGGSIHGTVTSPDGAAVPGALVLLRLQLPGDPKLRERVELAARSDAQGCFAFEGLPAGEVIGTQAHAEGFLALSQYAGRAGFAAIPLAKGETATVDITLRRGSVVHGRVTRKDEDTPVQDATVTLYYLGFHPPQEITCTTDADGRYRFEKIGDGRFMVLAVHPQHFIPEIEAARGQPLASGRRSPPPHLALDLKTDSTVERNIVLVPGVRMSGVVLGPDEKPAPGAHIFLKDYGLRSVSHGWGVNFHGQEEGVAVSGEDGRFALDGLPPRVDWVLFARKVGTAALYTEPIGLDDGPRHDVVVRLAAQCIVRGRVLDDNGEPLAGKHVYVTGFSALRGGSWKFTTQADGSFELHSLPANKLNISTSHQKQRIQKQVVLKDAGEIIEGLELRFGTLAEIRGVVRTSRGAPLAKLQVMTTRADGLFETREARTDAQGRFRITNVTPGKVYLSVAVQSGRSRKHVTGVIEAPARNVEITYDIPTLTKLKGEVLLPDGQPLPLGKVQTWSNDNKGTRPREFRNGRFDIEVEGKPPYRVTISEPRGADGTRLDVQRGYANVSDPARAVTIRLQAGVGIAGRIVGENGKGIVGVSVQSMGSSVRTDMDGEWKLTGLVPGRVPVVIQPPQGFIPPGRIVVDTGTMDIVTTLKKGLSIGGRAVVPEGVKLQGGQVTARWTRHGTFGSGQARGRIMENGAFTILGVPPGATVRLEARLWQRQDVEDKLAPVTVETVKAGRKDVVIEFAPGVSVSGTVHKADGTPLADGGVSLQQALSRNSGYGATDKEGRFEVGGLRPGTYMLHVFMGGKHLGAMREITVPATGLRIVLPDKGSIAGTLLGMPSGERWIVKPIDPETGMPLANVRANVSADGTWTLDAVDKGRKWIVLARSSGGKSDHYARSAPVQVGTTGLELRLETGVSITGRVVHDGLGLADCSVHAVGPGWSSFAATDGGGEFVLRGVAPGRYKLHVRHFTLNIEAKREDVEAGATGVEIKMGQ